MTYKFKYHPDGWVGFNGVFLASYEDFIAKNPEFPIIKGEFFEYRNDNHFEITTNIGGTYTGIKRNISTYAAIVNAVNALN